jgi:hypothetical protein
LLDLPIDYLFVKIIVDRTISKRRGSRPGWAFLDKRLQSDDATTTRLASANAPYRVPAAPMSEMAESGRLRIVRQFAWLRPFGQTRAG